MSNTPAEFPKPQPSLMGFSQVPDFGFDDWKNLYETNPVAFESRRQAVLAIELSKVGPRGARARVCLSKLEQAMKGKTGAERAELSMLWMAESAMQLKEQLDALQPLLDSLKPYADLVMPPKPSAS
jgi:hypothetical protein